MPLSVRALALTLALAATEGWAEVDVSISDAAAIDDACLADGANSEECGLSLRQLRGERKTSEIQQHSDSSDSADLGFCCYAGAVKGKTCSTCLGGTSIAMEGEYCAGGAGPCGGCGGTWCKARCVFSGENPNDICGTAFASAIAADTDPCSESATACGGCSGKWCGVDDVETSGDATVAGEATDATAVDTPATPAATAADPGFCCYKGSNPADKCGSCGPTAIAKEDTYCAVQDNCGGCGGSWCKARCVYSSADPDDVCGTAFDTAIAEASSSCSHSERLCTGCKGTWCVVPGQNITDVPDEPHQLIDPDENTEASTTEEPDEPDEPGFSGLPGDFSTPQ